MDYYLKDFFKLNFKMEMHGNLVIYLVINFYHSAIGQPPPYQSETICTYHQRFGQLSRSCNINCKFFNPAIYIYRDGRNPLAYFSQPRSSIYNNNNRRSPRRDDRHHRRVNSVTEQSDAPALSLTERFMTTVLERLSQPSHNTTAAIEPPPTSQGRPYVINNWIPSNNPNNLNEYDGSGQNFR